MADLTGKVALVTGAGSGIGEACARGLSRLGAAVLVADRNGKEANRVARDLLGGGATASAFRADVSRPDQVAAMVGAAMSRYGSLHVAVNNAGIPGKHVPIDQTPSAMWHRILSVNLDGVFYCMQEEIRAMRSTGGGSIVNIGSILSLVGYPLSASYVASKHGVLGLSRAAAIDHATENIRVNVVAPGFVSTAAAEKGWTAADRDALEALHPSGRLGRPDDVAAVVAFLACDDARNITGSVYTTDGGYTVRLGPRWILTANRWDMSYET